MNEHPLILLTGFVPFGGEDINPSWEAVRVLDGKHIGGHRVISRLLPTAFAESQRDLALLVDEVQPAILLGVGQAGGRSRLSIERVAINVQDARMADNAGAQPIDEAIVADGPAAYFSTLPIKAMLKALLAEGLPAEVSNTAGTFVCNHVAYLMLHLAAKHRDMRAGFIHIPYLPSQAARFANMPSMPKDDVVRALSIVLEVAVSRRDDDRFGAGTLD
ncbi:pyroglutamyl-peptidase I [Dyella nitratireducens]|uniref:Pyrrolidone-carboxylate peptidase n=1 Tax=Dyella nitratireducens TaxID=1849580 RepID=A0ABQ1G8W7_9GAMM|nr:pyroglutamyl-peptidase I [Dyella nitratireducens]GGA39055.1 pyrrolidone-carboxylate peptidase [Dyella nitratireducens]GLQ40397.1 pyrrolidone-carboxylate peptidase [Dyella nitratireducens]